MVEQTWDDRATTPSLFASYVDSHSGQFLVVAAGTVLAVRVPSGHKATNTA